MLKYLILFTLSFPLSFAESRFNGCNPEDEQKLSILAARTNLRLKNEKKVIETLSMQTLKEQLRPGWFFENEIETQIALDTFKQSALSKLIKMIKRMDSGETFICLYRGQGRCASNGGDYAYVLSLGKLYLPRIYLCLDAMKEDQTDVEQMMTIAHELSHKEFASTHELVTLKTKEGFILVTQEAYFYETIIKEGTQAFFRENLLSYARYKKTISP